MSGIGEALSKIKATQIKTRKTGLDDLRRALDASRNGIGKPKINDEGYSKLLKEIFEAISEERSGSSKKARGTQDKLLGLVEAFRLIVEHGVKVFRRKRSAPALVDHIVKTLVDENGQLPELLARPYAKILRTFLEYRPHVDHLSEEEFRELVSLCILGLSSKNDSNDSDEDDLVEQSLIHPASKKKQLSRSGTPATLNMSFRSNGKPRVSGPDIASNQTVEDFCACLALLSSVPHQPILSVADPILAAVFRFLDSASQSSFLQTQEHAFLILNSLLRLTSLESLNTAIDIVRKGLPHLITLWHFKAHSGLKDQMLAFLLRCRPLFPKMVAEIDGFSEDLQQISDTLFHEYSRRRDSDMLHMDDLILGHFVDHDSRLPMYHTTFQLRTGVPRTEQNWILLESIASTAVLRAATIKNGLPQTTPQRPHHAAKKRKTEHPVLDVIRDIQSSDRSEKLATLQLTTFIAASLSFNDKYQQTFLEALVLCITSEDAQIANWALLATASVAASVKAISGTSAFTNAWKQVWELSLRALAISTQCRAAAHLLTTILWTANLQFHEITESIDNMLKSIDLNGPGALYDTTCQFWCLVLRIKVQYAPGSAHEISQRVCQWLFVHWRPATSSPRASIKGSQAYSTANIASLCEVIFGIHHHLDALQMTLERGVLAITEKALSQDQPMSDYLLLLPDKVGRSETGSDSRSLSTAVNMSDARSKTLLTDLYTFLEDQTTSLLESGLFVNPTANAKATSDLTRSATTLALVSLTLLCNAELPKLAASEAFREKTMTLAQRICAYVRHSKNGLAGLDGIYTALGDATCLRASGCISSAATAFAKCFTPDFWISMTMPSEDVSIDDMMLIDESFESQANRSLSNTQDTASSRPADGTQAELKTYRLCQRVKMIAAFYRVQATSSADPEALDDGFFDYLTNLKGEELVLVRPVLDELLQSQLSFSNAATGTLLQHAGSELLTRDEFERAEVAHCITLDLLQGTVQQWIRADGDLGDTVEQLYDWFVRVALPRRILSATTQTELAKLLQKIMEERPDYGISLGLDSPRQIFLRIFEEGSSVVKFAIGENLALLFKMFVLKEHNTVLDDIFSSLPVEPDCLEATAVRLHIMVALGCAWPTLLRRCLYAIVEAPALVPNSTQYASYCFRSLSSKLDIHSQVDLFKLFAPQIIYTWLDGRSAPELPYELFGYGSVKDFLIDSGAEIAAQMIMRGQELELDGVARSCSLTTQELIRTAFPKAAAYCIGRDASIRPEADPKAANGILRLQKLLGKNNFVTAVQGTFPEILSLLFKISDREESFNRGLERHQAYPATNSAYSEIISSGASQAPLDVSQQPSFKASSLMDEIEFLRSIVDTTNEAIWTPSMYTYIFRDTMSMIQPALGSLFTCTVIRRLRILVSIAGEVALSDYPLKMALHALRGFVTDSQCAEDVMGICRYLLSHSTSYLQSEPSFLIGFAVSTMVSLRAFMETPKDSTTQESDYVATMTRARDFHGWLHTLLTNFTSPHLNANDLGNLRNIADSAAQIRRSGSSRAGTSEAELLKTVFGSGDSGRLLINDNARRTILDVLCAQFEFDPDYRGDILGEDEVASKSATLLLQALLDRDRNPNFKSWVARVLGRAYAGKGPETMKELKAVLDPPLQVETTAAQGSELNESRRIVLIYLQSLLASENLQHVNAAEGALHSILSIRRTPGDPINECLDRFLDEKLRAGFRWSTWSPTVLAMASQETLNNSDLAEHLRIDYTTIFDVWLRKLCISLIACCQADSLISRLAVVVEEIVDAPKKLISPLLHMALVLGSGKKDVRNIVSRAFVQWMSNPAETPTPYLKTALDAIVYLRGQPLPRETVKADRSQWLEIDYKASANAAIRCEMYTTALLFLEISISQEMHSGSRRTSTRQIEVPVDTLLEIYRNVDDKDSFYGVRQPSTLPSMLEQLEFENAGFRSLSFRAADYNAQMQLGARQDSVSAASTMKLLNDVQLNGISLAMIGNVAAQQADVQDTMFTAARKLERWDITAPPNVSSQPAVLFKTFQAIHDKSDPNMITRAFDMSFTAAVGSILDHSNVIKLQNNLETLAVLTEIEDTITSRNTSQVRDAFTRLVDRNSWMVTSRHDNIKTIDSCRQTIFGVLNNSKELKSLTKIQDKDACILNIEALLSSSSLNRRHKESQVSLNIVTYLTQAADAASEAGAKIDAAIAFETSHVLWDQGEMTPSIQMLRDIAENRNLGQQDIHVGRPCVLATLGHRIAEARLEKPDEVIEHYLKPAVKDLKGTTSGSEAGQVYHEFAEFCDLQLQIPESMEDLKRIEVLREKKQKEVDELNTMLKDAGSQSKDKDIIKNQRTKAKRWFELDDNEYRRLKESREALLSQSLENYLLCLRSCNDYDNDALRFAALWLEHYEDDHANSSVKHQIQHVPSRKFASLMNQWTSRQQDEDTEFQKQLFNLVLRICSDHPYHGMYHVFTSSKSKGAKDPGALSRNAAATKVALKLKDSRKTQNTWIAVHNTNVNFVRFAGERPAKAREGAKLRIANSQCGQKLETDIRSMSIPPPTMTIPLRDDCNYDSVPRLHQYVQEYSLASGISMPKIVTAITSDGQRFKQLFKSGNDDLRQDAIMEQVFQQVSSLLRHHAETRQRDMRIRTYKVLPLTSSTGIIEFVTDTIPLNNYLMPAHEAHYPKDMKPLDCRRLIAEAQNKTNQQRVAVYHKICEKFHPIMRYFFTDRFLDPDEWFEKRLMYTRSTAAISMLGFILGLGDRHGQNILLDEKTGEVVHIDLGIAFETGRVLPVPEMVPFRMTRDIVDGMGITGTEGVFRRCCEFMLEALRKEEYSIMTILDVLRYDPLYNWSVSPLRMKRLQDDQIKDEIDNTAAEKIRDKVQANGGSSGGTEDEAERALTVVKKKLSKSLSVAATVNELILQATDARNLAVLFAGWAAYL